MNRAFKYREGTFPKLHFNYLFAHVLDRFTQFGNSLHFCDQMIMGDNISLRTAVTYGYVCLSNAVFVKFVQIAIDSCCALQDRLSIERKPGCVRELITAIEETLLIIGGVILVLIKRDNKTLAQEHDFGNLNNWENQTISKILLNELLHRCPVVSAPFVGYSSPVTNIMFKAKHKRLLFTRFTQQCLMYNLQLAKMIIECQYDLNATDHEGNTLLHVIMSDVYMEIEFLKLFVKDPILSQHIETTFQTVHILLDNGSYPQAKNKRGKYPCDGFEHGRLQRYCQENLHERFQDLFAKYDSQSIFSLKCLAKTVIRKSRIPYKNFLPVALVKFVDFH